MKTMLAAVALAGALWGCDAKAESAAAAASPVNADGPAYTARVKIDDV
ncbi:MAG: hypothetical protein HY293_05610 [Planctomycetes bacterium]|nr:hypothetical protein [Planctomycetota bacterium]